MKTQMTIEEKRAKLKLMMDCPKEQKKLKKQLIKLGIYF